ncbi:SRPBCC family protein [Streptacidiphilus melanogenes]|uniref:SRPBCC family protein n=1 Tax=Streptacidiphilus melanogenes TaxID=411235 RepID=UPI0006936F94|nr:SRPBCC family protein [Streptacidiphilus melanogenes]
MTVEVNIPARPERVWELVSDISTSPRFSPELQRTEWLEGATGPMIGAHFAGHNARPDGRRWQTVSRITEYAPLHRFAWAVLPDVATAPGDAFAHWHYELRPDGAGTVLVHGMRLGNLRTPVHAFVEAHPEQEEAVVDARLASLRNGIEAVLGGVAAHATRD